jgi:hypothetical protein
MRRTPHPLIEFACLKVRTFAIVIWGRLLFDRHQRVTLSLPLMFQVPFGMSAFNGLLVLAMFAGNLSMKPITTPVLRRFGFRSVLLVNGVITAALICSFSLLAPQTPRPLIVAAVPAWAVALHAVHDFEHPAFVDIPAADEPGQQFSIGGGADGDGNGVAVGAVALRAAAWMHSQQTGVPTLSDFHVAFALVSVIALLAVFDCFGLERHAGAEVSGHGA